MFITTTKVEVVSAGGSVSHPPTGWGDLPTEVLIEILNKLIIKVDKNGHPRSTEEKQALLNCRLMNRRWRDAVDDVLQKQTFKFWTAWTPHLSIEESTGYSHCFGILHLAHPLFGASFPRSDIVCPRFLTTKIWENSPSPNKSVCVTKTPDEGLTFRHNKDENYMWRYVSVFDTFGEHLSSITFFNVSSMHIEMFQRILSSTRNLKAMTLQNIKITAWEHDIKNFTLPLLPKLTHLKLLDIHWKKNHLDYEKNMESSDLSLRILSEYIEQLETLDTNAWFGGPGAESDEGLDDFEFECFGFLQFLQLGFLQLKQLKIFMKDLDCESLPLPSVTHLCLIDFPFSDLTLVKELPYLLRKSKKTLAQLHIQLNPEKTAAMEENPEHDNWECPTLPNVKMFAISYPRLEEGLEAVQRLLKMLPNLDQLNLIQFDDTVEESREATEQEKENARNHLLESQYWKVCKKLKTISVSMQAHDFNPFYTIRFPFHK